MNDNLRNALAHHINEELFTDLNDYYLENYTYDEFLDGLTTLYSINNWAYTVNKNVWYTTGYDALMAAFRFYGDDRGPVHYRKRFIVYKRTCLATGKIYIGLTGDTPEQRAKEGGKGYIQNPRMQFDIHMHGWNSFQTEILAANLTPEDADKLETEMIIKYKSSDPRFGYNIDSKQ